MTMTTDRAVPGSVHPDVPINENRDNTAHDQ